MTISQEQIKGVAYLARLGLSDSDVPVYANNLNNILALMAQMQAVDTTDVAPMAHAFDATQPLRPDAITEGNERDELLAIAPATEFGLYLVPQVIE
ncbi:MAG: Asp-tRNA(Asn)/Glu-tRNA(Gln) amidotransferase subunit GatC [Gammaproteobacteria bacterium]